MKPILASGLTASLLILTGVAFADTATVIKSSDLKAKPQLDATTTGSVSERSEVTIMATDGGWTQIKTADGKQGWVRMFSLRTKTAAASPGNVLGAIAKTGSSSSAPTTGVKGLDKVDLEKATPNYKEVALLEKYDVSSNEAKRYAQSSGLKAQSVDYLDGSK